jgi:putative spermidine/putrescine transport system substrate-binding protein
VDNPATLPEIEAELEKFRGSSLVFTSWGGAYQAAQRQAWLIPFQAKFGIEIIEESPTVYAKIRIMAETGNVTWHVVDVGMREAWAAGGVGALEELDFSIIDNRDNLETTVSPWTSGPGITWATVLAYNPDTYPEGSQPRTWADFFDVERFPGRRGVRDTWFAQLTFAVLGDDPDLLNTVEGRDSLSALTPEQVDRAFEIWEEWKSNVTRWWNTGSECPELLMGGELDMCIAWNGRIFDAVKAQGAPLGIAWEAGQLLSTDPVVIPKGLKAEDPDKFYLAQLFMAWASFPKVHADIAKYISYGPINIKSIPYLDDPAFDEVRPELPTSAANIPYAILLDEYWAGQHADEWIERWLVMMQE